MAKNLDCPCKRVACPRHGDCAECRAKHKTTLPSCERPPKKAKKEGARSVKSSASKETN